MESENIVFRLFFSLVFFLFVYFLVFYPFIHWAISPLTYLPLPLPSTFPCFQAESALISNFVEEKV
jgi:hypothetical protein